MEEIRPQGTPRGGCNAENFARITVGTAKCDTCQERNKDTLKRCKLCYYQLCGRCFAANANEPHPGSELDLA